MLREHGADWLDAPDQAAITAAFATVDEDDDYVSGRPISSEKSLEAALTFSLARRHSAFSRLRRLISACSSLVVPRRSPFSTSARRTHRRIVSGVLTPNFS